LIELEKIKQIICRLYCLNLNLW